LRRQPIPWHTAADPLVEAAEPWLLYPLFGAGALTVLIGEAKYAGKSTLVLNLLGQMLRSGSFAARAPVWAPVVYFTEQPPTSFRQTLYQSGVLGCEELHFIHRHEVSRYDWPATVEILAEKCDREAAKYLVIDTFSGCVGLRGEEENSAGGLIKEKIEQLQNICASQGVAALVTHHMRKQRADEGAVNLVNASRGHSGLSDTADLLGALRNPTNNIRHLHRQLEIIGRFSDLPVDPLQLRWVEGSYLEQSSFALVEAAELLYAALPDTAFSADQFNEIAGYLQVDREQAWHALRHLQREGALEVLEKGQYQKI